MENFKAGDVVMLLSAGPTMTIYEVVGQECRCIWYSHQECKFVRDTFKALCLKKN